MGARNNTNKGIKLIRRYSESLKLKVVEEVSSGRLTTKEAMRHYDVIHRKTIDRWMCKYGARLYQTQVIRVIMKSEQEQIRELKEALADSDLTRRVYAAQLKAYARYVPDLKKKLSGKELNQFEENQKKIDGFR